MKKISEPIVFFGSGPVAAKSLEDLAGAFNIEAVITKPRPHHHKGAVPVLEVAEGLALQVYSASNKQELDDLFAQKQFVSNIGVLVDFGIIVSQKVIEAFPQGIVNSHFSLLPAWRGADPITFTILNGDSETGVSLMLLVEAMDEGPILAQGHYQLHSDITTPELTEDLIELSSAMLKEIIPLYLTGKAHAAPQDTGKPASYSRKLTKEDGILNWHKPAEVLEREIRAFVGWPKSRTHFRNLEVAITKSHVLNVSGNPGTTAIIDKLPVVFCGDKALVLDKVKPANKKEITGQAFLAGYKTFFL